MNLQQVKSENTRKFGSYISLGKAGLISFSKEAAAALKLEHETKIMFLQDKDKPKDWYLNVFDDGDNKIRYYKECLCGFNSSSIAISIKESVNYSTSKSLRLQLGVPFEHEGKTLVALLTAKV